MSKTKKCLYVVPIVLFYTSLAWCEQITWVYSLQDALSLAKEENKLIMIDVYATWCHWCKVLDKTTYKDEFVVSEAEKMISVKIDGEKDKDFAAKYRIGGFPNILFLNSDGDLIKRLDGYVPAKNMYEFMKSVYETEDIYKRLKEKLSQESDDLSIWMSLAELYIKRMRHDKAIPLLKHIIANDKQNENGFTIVSTLKLGICYFDQKQFDNGIKQMELFQKSYADHEFIDQAYFFIGLGYLYKDNKVDALKNFRYVLEHFPESSMSKKASQLISFIETETDNSN